MKIRATQTFVGTFNMKKDEIKECDDERVVNDLKKLGLAEDTQKTWIQWSEERNVK